MDSETCAQRLAQASFGVLGTVDAAFGVHLVPVVYVIAGDRLAIPIDTVKPKSSASLRRLVNLKHEPRATLLVDHRDLDWSQLWWVRVLLEYAGTSNPERWQARLSDRYPQYRAPGSITSVLEFLISDYVGWTASRP